MEVLELKNIVADTNNFIYGLNIKLDAFEERISELKDEVEEDIQTEAPRENTEKNLC